MLYGVNESRGNNNNKGRPITIYLPSIKESGDPSKWGLSYAPWLVISVILS